MPKHVKVLLTVELNGSKNVRYRKRLEKALEVQVSAATRKAVESGVHTGFLQAKTARDLHRQFCPECKPDKPWEQP
jgi:hypothetical protein